MQIGLNIDATALIFRHPQQKIFEEAALIDRELGSIFAIANESIGPVAWVWRNTGAGGTIQLSMLPNVILDAAWRHIKFSEPTAESLVAESVSQYRIIRRLLARKSQTITASFAFTGVLLPDGVEQVELLDGTLETVTASDRDMAPAGLKQQVTGTDAAGNTVVANYEGDVVLRLSMPLKIKVTQLPASGEVEAWPDDMHLPESLDRSVERLRLSVLLAVRRETPAQLLPTWRYFDDPFGHGHVSGWSDPRSAVGFMPTRLTKDEVNSWSHWYQALSHPRTDRINVAITRILKAVAERREPTDVLIDAVIGWENIFGTSEGEPTLRVTSSLAILLEDEVAKRKTLRSRLSKIYGLRSAVVHGNRSLKVAEFSLCQEALDVALSAIRVLTSERTDILDLPDGAARSEHLILGAVKSATEPTLK